MSYEFDIILNKNIRNNYNNPQYNNCFLRVIACQLLMHDAFVNEKHGSILTNLPQGQCALMVFYNFYLSPNTGLSNSKYVHCFTRYISSFSLLLTFCSFSTQLKLFYFVLFLRKFVVSN